jgi:hypothetical protein
MGKQPTLIVVDRSADLTPVYPIQFTDMGEKNYWQDAFHHSLTHTVRNSSHG